MLIDLSDRNNLGGGGGSGGMPAPPGFYGYPQPPPLPAMTMMDTPPPPFSYPVILIWCKICKRNCLFLFLAPKRSKLECTWLTFCTPTSIFLQHTPR
jgi:hypothetical protein